VARGGGTAPELPGASSITRSAGYSRMGAPAFSDIHSCVISSSSVSARSGDGLVHAVGERAVLLQHQAEVLLLVPGCRELADDGAVLHLDRGDEEGRGQVDHDAVHLPRVERGDGGIVAVVDRWLLARLDLLFDVREAGRTHLRPKPVGRHVSDGGGLGDGGVRVGDQRLVREEVAVAQVDRLGALIGIRHLRQVEVEVLLAGGERVVERHGDEVDRVVAEAETLGNGPRHGSFEAALVRRVTQLPRIGGFLALGWRIPVRREGRVIGPDGETAIGLRRQAVVGTRLAGARVGPLHGDRLAGAAAGARCEERNDSRHGCCP